MKKEVEDLGLKAEGLKVTVDGDTVKVSGKAASQEEKEKLILAMGNVAGVAKVEDAIETPGPRPPRSSTRSSRATTSGRSPRRPSAAAPRYKEIFEANRPMLTDPDKIYPGQVLRIPAK